MDENLLNCGHDIDVNKVKTIDEPIECDIPSASGFEISDERENPWMSQFDLDSSIRWETVTAQKNNFGGQRVNATSIPHEKFTGEVIDVDDTLAFQKDLFATTSDSFSLGIEKDYSARNTRMGKRPLTTTSLPMFPSPDTDSASGDWLSTNDRRHGLRGDTEPHFYNINRHDLSGINQKGFIEQNMMGKAPQNSYIASSQENIMRTFGGTPLSKALNSTHVQQGSPWTIEFLNRVREKSRLRSQSVSNEVPSPRPVSSGSTLKNTKRKSPSILEFYKYDRGSTPQKTFEQKRLKRPSRQENSLKNKKGSTVCPPSSCTPVDKRARRVGR